MIWQSAVACSHVSSPASRAPSVAGSRTTSCRDCTIQACARAEVIDSAVATSSTAHSLTVARIEGRAATDAGPEVARSNVRRTSGHSSRSPGDTILDVRMVPSVMSVSAPPGSAASTATFVCRWARSRV